PPAIKERAIGHGFLTIAGDRGLRPVDPSEDVRGTVDFSGGRMQRSQVVIVGASLAGATVAATLREDALDGDMRLIGAEPQLLYTRPPLSKAYLRGEEGFEAQLVKPAAYYTEQRIELMLQTRVTALDAKQKLVTCEGHEPVSYDRL